MTITAPSAWPLARVDRRATALAAVDAIRDELAAGAAESEAGRRLSDRSINALRDSGVLGIMTPDDLGGNVVDAVTAFEVIEKIGHIDPPPPGPRPSSSKVPANSPPSSATTPPGRSSPRASLSRPAPSNPARQRGSTAGT
ncbi:hypothetical protein FXW78_49515 [Rhodococcus opacus]|nr:hypothetical protein [Rhodococcus opacus]